MDNYIQWIDLAWIPVVLALVHKGQRLLALGFMGANIVMMRLLVELMVTIDYPFGILPLLDYHIFYRGLVIYSVIYFLYVLIAMFSPRSEKVVFMAASISLFFLATFAFTLVMVL